MPRKFEVEEERDNLLAKMEAAHAILGEALGLRDVDDDEDDDEVEDSEVDDED